VSISAEPDDLERMRALVVAVMHGQPLRDAPSAELLQTNHLAPIAYRMGVAACRNEYAASMIVADRRRRTLAEVIETFAKRRIEIALIKGCSFIGNIYPDPAERPMHDQDVLVRVERLDEAMRCMLDIGFERVGFTAKLSGFYHAQVFRRGDMMFELHRHIMQMHRTRLPIDDLWQRSILDPQGSGARRLDRVDELLICALHIARHELAVPAINYLDVWRLRQRFTEEQRALLDERAREYRVERSIAAVFSMTDHLAAGRRGVPAIGVGSTVLPTTDDVLQGVHPGRARQIAQKLLLTQGTRERLGLGFSWIAAIVDGWRRGRTFDEDMRATDISSPPR